MSIHLRNLLMNVGYANERSCEQGSTLRVCLAEVAMPAAAALHGAAHQQSQAFQVVAGAILWSLMVGRVRSRFFFRQRMTAAVTEINYVATVLSELAEGVAISYGQEGDAEKRRARPSWTQKKRGTDGRTLLVGVESLYWFWQLVVMATTLSRLRLRRLRHR